MLLHTIFNHLPPGKCFILVSMSKYGLLTLKLCKDSSSRTSSIEIHLNLVEALKQIAIKHGWTKLFNIFMNWSYLIATNIPSTSLAHSVVVLKFIFIFWPIFFYLSIVRRLTNMYQYVFIGDTLKTRVHICLSISRYFARI